MTGAQRHVARLEDVWWVEWSWPRDWDESRLSVCFWALSCASNRSNVVLESRAIAAHGSAFTLFVYVGGAEFFVHIVIVSKFSSRLKEVCAEINSNAQTSSTACLL